ncbi:MAG: transcriptional regulator [Methylotenera sp.]|jgi:transcriptional regulator with XRE-family HTH domain|nr:MAG: transcriptional regulator [Methylotenera sp.]
MAIPKGFGERLKAERKKLKLSQTELAEIGGVGRLAQSQYESEQSAPTTRYLSAISSAGVNLTYLVLGLRPDNTELTPEQSDRVESKAFEWIEIYSDAQSGGKLSAESRRLMYQVLRNLLTQVELGEIPADLAPKMFMSLKLPT